MLPRVHILVLVFTCVAYLTWMKLKSATALGTVEIRELQDLPSDQNGIHQVFKRSISQKRSRRVKTNNEELEDKEPNMDFLIPFVHTIPPMTHDDQPEPPARNRVPQDPVHGLQWIKLGTGLYGVSAFLDDFSFDKPVILVNVAAERPWLKTAKKVYCNYEQTRTKESETVGILHLRKPEENQMWVTGWLVCSTINNGIPHTIWIRTEQLLTEGIKIHAKHKSSLMPNFEICCTTTLSESSNAFSVIEFVELHKLLGSNHVSLYANNLEESLKKVQEYYQRSMEATFIPVSSSIPAQIVKELVKNDCIARSSGLYRYTAVTGLHKFIFPGNTAGLTFVAKSVSPKNGYFYIFPKLVFCTNFPINDSVQHFLRQTQSKSNGSLHLVTQLNTFSLGNPCYNYTNPTFMLKTETFALKQLIDEGDFTITIPPSMAMVHQYLQCIENHKLLFQWFDPCKFFPFPKVNTKAHEYIHHLSRKVQLISQKLT